MEQKQEIAQKDVRHSRGGNTGGTHVPAAKQDPKHRGSVGLSFQVYISIKWYFSTLGFVSFVLLYLLKSFEL